MEPWSFIKERLKRQLSLFTAIAMMLVSVFSAMPVMAEGVPTFAVSSATANPGDTVDVTINIENNPGIASAAMDVSFPDELTLTGVSLKSDVYTGQFNGPQSLPVTKKVRLNWANGLAENSTSGLFATLTFSVSESAGEGTYPISITYDPDDVFNLEETNINFQVSNGSITIGHKLAKTDAKAATCTEPGNSAYWSCSNCGKFFSDEEGNNEITENSWVISAAHTLVKTEAKAATCTEVGSSAYWTCTTCGKYFSDEAGKNEIAKNSWVIPAGHSLTKTDAKEPTCTEDGNNAYYTCSVCGKIFKDAEGTQETTFKNEILAASGHTMTKTDAKAATCTEDGNNAYYTCSACGKIFKDADGKTATTVEAEKIAATGHTMTKTEAKAATCTEDGNNEYYTCSACGKAFKDADGKTVTTVEAEKLAATGHTMAKTEAKAATCTEDGNTAYWYCSVCNKYFSDENGTNETTLPETVVKAHHTLTKTDAKESTCTAEGNNAYYTCSVCGRVFKDEAGTQPTTVAAETLEKKAHTPVVDAAVAATCEKAGLTEGSHCSVCNEVLVAQKVVDKIPHTLTKTEAKAATCTEDGNNEYYTCSACGKAFKDADGKTVTTVEAEKLAATGHTMAKTEAKAATCTEDGNTAYWYCSVCNKYFSDENGTNETTLDNTVVKAHHTMTKTDTKEPTCTAEGNNAYYTCSVCGKVFKDEAGTQPTTVEAETLEKKAHTPVVDAAVAATCQKTGLTEGKHCSVCNEVLVAQKVVDKIPHSLTKTEAKAATCTEDGNNEYYTCSACGKAFKDADGKTVTTVEAEKLAATGHTMAKTEAKAATCTEDGNTAYWYCSVCNKYFSDENGTTETTLPDTVVKAHHTMTKTDAKEPTCTEEGNNAYYTCSVCGKVFKDEAGTQPTTVEDETLAKKAHTPVVDVAVAATCQKTGLTEGSHCSVCNEVLVAQKVVDKIPHTVVVDAAVEPTYSSTGLTEGKHCSVCNEVIEKQTVIPAKSESNVTVIGDESFAGPKKELADAVLSAEDIENINSGKDITIRLNVALKSDATDAIKEQVKAKLKDYTIGAFYDIDITKSIDGDTPVAVTSTNAPVHIQLTLAGSLINMNSAVKRTYKVVRFHYDEAANQTVVDILDATYHAGYNKLDFDSDKFSVYTVVYKDTEIVTTTPTPAPTTKPDSTADNNSSNSNNSTVEKPSVTGKVCPVCGYNNCKLGNDNRWHCGKCAHSWQEYGKAESTSSTGNAPKSPKTGLF